jgi:hypothetical protein
LPAQASSVILFFLFLLCGFLLCSFFLLCHCLVPPYGTKTSLKYNNRKHFKLTVLFVKEAKSISYTFYRPNARESFKKIFIDVVFSVAEIVYDGEL